MPFYGRIRPRPPIWQPILVWAAPMLVLTAARAAFVVPALTVGRPGVLARLFYVVGFTVVGGSVAGACFWVLDLPPLRASDALRWLAGTFFTAAYLVAFSLAAGQFGPTSPSAQLTRPAFVIGTVIVSALFGWLLGKGVLTRAGTTERIYLSPADYAALSPSDQADLTPEEQETKGSKRA